MISNFPSMDNDIENALTYYALEQENNNDFLILTSGYEKCNSNKRIIGPLQHGYYILHYVHSGKGLLKININTENDEEKTFSLTKGQMFLIYPNVTTSYWPDKEDPWEYSWVSFCGSAAFNHANRLTDKSNPIINIKQTRKIEKAFLALQKLDEYPHAKDLKIVSITMEIFSEIIEESGRDIPPNKLKNYVRDCLIYIQNNYKEPNLTVKQISKELGLNEKYLSRLFTAALQIPISRYIILLRLQKACSLLNSTELTIKEIAFSVGYNDPLYFSRIFSEYIKISPSQWRKQNTSSAKKQSRTSLNTEKKV